MPGTRRAQEERGAEYVSAAFEGAGAGAVEPGGAGNPGATGVKPGAGAAEPGVSAGTPGASVGAQVSSRGHDSAATCSRTMGQELGGIGSWVTIHVDDERFGPGHAWQITDEQRSERGLRFVVETMIERGHEDHRCQTGSMQGAGAHMPRSRSTGSFFWRRYRGACRREGGCGNATGTARWQRPGFELPGGCRDVERAHLTAWHAK